MNHVKSNSKKSNNGYSLNKDVQYLLLDKLNRNEIKNYRYEPRYNFPNYENEQFSPDGEITLKNGNVIIIDNTTTIRHDRFKQKQWDAYGIKTHFNALNPTIKVFYYVILPDKHNLGDSNNKEKEYKNFIREKNKCKSNNYYSVIDDILHISELMAIIERNEVK